jgi:predicted DCC family thiol-disulfide oxidoreductase YuxK
MTFEPGARRLRPIEPIHEPMTPLTVLYDGECGFCRWTAANLRRWDVERRLRVRPYQETDREPILKELLRGHRLAESVHTLDGAGRVADGAAAVLAITAVLPCGRPVVQLFEASPPARVGLTIAYALLNRWRGRIADFFRLNGPRLDEPPGLDPRTTEVRSS